MSDRANAPQHTDTSTDVRTTHFRSRRKFRKLAEDRTECTLNAIRVLGNPSNVEHNRPSNVKRRRMGWFPYMRLCSSNSGLPSVRGRIS